MLRDETQDWWESMTSIEKIDLFDWLEVGVTFEPTLEFLHSLEVQFKRWGKLSDKQIESLKRMYDKREKIEAKVVSL